MCLTVNHFLCGKVKAAAWEPSTTSTGGCVSASCQQGEQPTSGVEGRRGSTGPLHRVAAQQRRRRTIPTVSGGRPQTNSSRLNRQEQFLVLATRGLINKTSRFEANSSLSNSRQLCRNKMATTEDIWRITPGDFHR